MATNSACPVYLRTARYESGTFAASRAAPPSRHLAGNQCVPPVTRRTRNHADLTGAQAGFLRRARCTLLGQRRRPITPPARASSKSTGGSRRSGRMVRQGRIPPAVNRSSSNQWRLRRFLPPDANTVHLGGTDRTDHRFSWSVIPHKREAG